MTTYLLKLGELTLKGSNIKEFEKRLVANAYSALEGTGCKIQLRAGRMYINCQDNACSFTENVLNHLIGITSWTKADICSGDTTSDIMQDIKNKAISLATFAKQKGDKTFKIEARRVNKAFAFNSYQIACQVGQAVVDTGLLSVDVHKPDLEIGIEIREKNYIYGKNTIGNRGLPVGVSGQGILLLSGGIDSPVAGYKMLCRGLKLDCIYFHAHPYTSPEAQQKVETLAKILSQYAISLHLNIIPFTKVQMAIKDKAPEEWSTLMLRMAMIKTANILAKYTKAQCLVTGESLGQVASQTLQNMTATEAVADLPLLRPLVGTDKEEITQIAKKIGTYDTSILPYEDCCVLFSPRHPILHAKLQQAFEIYSSLDLEPLIQEAFEKREYKRFCIKQ